MNAAVYAMKMLQNGMAKEAENSGLDTEDAINGIVAEVRGEVEGLCVSTSRKQPVLSILLN